jgi:hypothetical protein
MNKVNPFWHQVHIKVEVIILILNNHDTIVNIMLIQVILLWLRLYYFQSGCSACK